MIGVNAQIASESGGNDDVGFAGDEIVSIEGRAVGSADELRAAIDDRESGEKVTLGILRNGARRELDVTLGTRPA